MLYCVKERTFTPDVEGSVNYFTSKNGRSMIQSICQSCGSKKTSFTGSQDIGKGFDLHKMIGKLPRPTKGFTLPGHNFTGPYNPLEKQVDFDPKTRVIYKINQLPSGITDAIAMAHDIDYNLCKNEKNPKKCKNRADKKMVERLDSVPKNQRQTGHTLARNVINAKQKLGLGLNSKKI